MRFSKVIGKGFTGAAVLLGLLGALAGPAAAYTEDSNGSPGRVQPYVVLAEYQKGMSGSARIGTDGPDVYRSPRIAGTQSITVTYSIWQANTCWNLDGCSSGFGSVEWTKVTERSSTIDVGPGHYASFPRVIFDLGPSGGPFAMHMLVEWKTGSTRDAATGIYNVDRDDYRCGANCTVDEQPDGTWAVHFTGI